MGMTELLRHMPRCNNVVR